MRGCAVFMTTVLAAVSVAVASGTETTVTMRDGTTRLVPHRRGSSVPLVKALCAGEAWDVAVRAEGDSDIERALSAEVRAERCRFGGRTAAKTGLFELRTFGLAKDVRRLSVNEGVLRFVVSEESPVTGPELIANSGFENRGAGWSRYVHPSDVVYAAQYSTPAFAYSTDSWAFGFAAYDGDFCLRAHNNGGASTRVEFPAAGDYRLMLHIRPRTDSTTINPLLVMLKAEDGTTTEIYRGAIAYAPCFFEYGFTFHVAKAGAQTLVITGLGIPRGRRDAQGRILADLSLLIDGVSVRAVSAPPSRLVQAMGPDVSVSVAEGAKLAFDGIGVNEVALLSLGGRYVSGEVSAKTHPDYILGVGTIRVRPAKPFHVQINKEETR